jgi:hypothetical protein
VGETLLARTDQMAVTDYRCAAKPGDPNFVEHHEVYSLS